MRFRCPSCGFSGQVQVPAHFPRGKTARVRCARCRHAVTLAVGRLWPQDSAEAYEALVPGAKGCTGGKVGRLWVEIAGARAGTPPLVALQPHPSFSHEILHDLLDPFLDYFQVAYVEFPGSQLNPGAPEDVLEALLASLDLLKVKLKTPRIHVLGHLDSCRLALHLAAARPRDLVSLILLEPLLRGSPPAELTWEPGSGQELAPEAAAEAVRGLAVRHWGMEPEDPHVLGLARLLSPGLSPALFRSGEQALHPRSSYPRLARLRTPALIFNARDGAAAARADALYLAATLPGAELVPLEKGGSMAAWAGGTWFANKLLSFKRGAEKAPAERRRGQTASGQPLAWLAVLLAILAWGLQAGLGWLTLQPPFMRLVLPAALGALLPIFWFLMPRGFNPFVLHRFRAFRARTVLLPLTVGALLGAAFFSLNASGLAWRPPAPAALPDLFASLPLGHPGRPYLFLALLASAVFCFGLLGNLVLLRRLRAGLLLPIVLFAVVPLSWPDLLWSVPASVVAALLFAHDLSIFSPLAVVTGVFFGSELPAAYLRQPDSLGALAGAPGWVLALILLIGAAFLTAMELTWKRGYTAEVLYFSTSLSKGATTYRWRPAIGVVLVIFSSLAAAAVVFGFLRAQ